MGVDVVQQVGRRIRLPRADHPFLVHRAHVHRQTRRNRACHFGAIGQVLNRQRPGARGVPGVGETDFFARLQEARRGIEGEGAIGRLVGDADRAVGQHLGAETTGGFARAVARQDGVGPRADMGALAELDLQRAACQLEDRRVDLHLVVDAIQNSAPPHRGGAIGVAAILRTPEKGAVGGDCPGVVQVVTRNDRHRFSPHSAGTTLVARAPEPLTNDPPDGRTIPCGGPPRRRHRIGRRPV